MPCSGWGGLGAGAEMPAEVLLIESAPHDWLLPQCALGMHPCLSAIACTLSSLAPQSPSRSLPWALWFAYNFHNQWDTFTALVAATSHVHVHSCHAVSQVQKTSATYTYRLPLAVQVRCMRPPWRRGNCGGGPHGGTPYDGGALLRGPGVLGHGRLQVTTAAAIRLLLDCICGAVRQKASHASAVPPAASSAPKQLDSMHGGICRVWLLHVTCSKTA